MSIKCISFSFKYEYEYDERGNRVLLGRGSFGAVFACRNLDTNVKMAVKEIPERDTRSVLSVESNR